MAAREAETVGEGEFTDKAFLLASSVKKAVFNFSIEMESMREMVETKEEYSGPRHLSIAIQDKSSSNFSKE